MSSEVKSASAPAYTDVLSLGFGASVLMWAVGYFGNLPGLAGSVPHWLVLLLIVLALFFCAFKAGQLTGRGWQGGLFTGLISGVINLLVLNSLLVEATGGTALPHPVIAAIGYLVLSAVIGVLGGALGRTRRDTRRAAPDWVNVFCWIVGGATLLLIIEGGVVTSVGDKAALSVPDWPNSFGANMFLLPLAKMAGPIYFEHAHRLFAALIGLTTFVLALLITLSPGKLSAKVMGWVAFGMVGLQGVLGGLRVTLSDNMLALLHGVLAQLFLAVLAALTVLTAPYFKSTKAPKIYAGADADRASALVAVCMILFQLLLGALVRHMHILVMAHMGIAVLVLAACITAGIRNWGAHPDITVLRKAGMGIMHLAGVQFLLGFATLMTGVTALANDQLPTSIWQVILPTAHQTVGALLLAWAVRVWLLSARLVSSGAKEQTKAA